MNEFTRNFKKRCQPLFGTFVSVGLETDEQELFYQASTAAFYEGWRLEGQFSKFVAQSTLMQLNRTRVNQSCKVEKEFFECLELALELWRLSNGAFNPFGPTVLHTAAQPFTLFRSELVIVKNIAVELDLNGIAKGFVVDRMIGQIELHLHGQNIAAFVNAGGDLRYLNTPQPSVHVRSGAYDQPILNEVPMLHNSFATSSWSVAMQSDHSSTEYDLNSPHWSHEQTIGVNANDCWVADAMTKVAMYASHDLAQTCANAYDAKIFVFDGHGQIIL